MSSLKQIVFESSRIISHKLTNQLDLCPTLHIGVPALCPPLLSSCFLYFGAIKFAADMSGIYMLQHLPHKSELATANHSRPSTLTLQRLQRNPSFILSNQLVQSFKTLAIDPACAHAISFNLFLFIIIRNKNNNRLQLNGEY